MLVLLYGSHQARISRQSLTVRSFRHNYQMDLQLFVFTGGDI